ncbi:MAG: histidine phosphatase family protein [Alphaproteobacteria bacterium]|nr:histidine phosphatase family protein [Alphaproteobacteria bacterium]
MGRASRMLRIPLLLAGMLLSGCMMPTPAPAPEVKAPPPPLPLAGEAAVAALGQGGLIVYLRHAEADRGIDQDPLGLGPCATQRQLSDTGRAEAAAIGRAVARLGLPAGRIASSPYCRAIETAALIFPGREIEILHDLRLWHGRLEPGERERLTRSVRAILSARPEAGNLWLIGHQSSDGLGLELAQGEAAIVEPRGPEGFRVLARMRPAGWAAHLEAPARAPVRRYALPEGLRAARIAPEQGGGVWIALSGGEAFLRLDAWTGDFERGRLPQGEPKWLDPGQPPISGWTLAPDGRSLVYVGPLSIP